MEVCGNDQILLLVFFFVFRLSRAITIIVSCETFHGNGLSTLGEIRLKKNLKTTAFPVEFNIHMSS